MATLDTRVVELEPDVREDLVARGAGGREHTCPQRDLRGRGVGASVSLERKERGELCAHRGRERWEGA